jgi:hypothetical protein
MDKIIPSFEELKILNPSRFSEADYINYLMNIAKQPRDLVFSFMELFFPKFEIFGDDIFNMSFGTYESYKSNLDHGFSEADAYYWSQIIDVGGLFLISYSDASVIADQMCVGWNRTLAHIGYSRVTFLKHADEDILLLPKIDIKL